jgi:NAD(P)-dependent dehydrogenase (short-subunit alcohol dehydrogenase family)
MKDKVIVVSGGANGIGAEVSARLAAEGARVVITDLNGAQAEAKAAGIAGLGVACDISSPEQCEKAAQAAVDKFGRIDGIVNCAGISTTASRCLRPSGRAWWMCN